MVARNPLNALSLLLSVLDAGEDLCACGMRILSEGFGLVGAEHCSICLGGSCARRRVVQSSMWQYPHLLVQDVGGGCRAQEHCLMGIKGTVRRAQDCHVIHANVDTDIIVAEEAPFGSTRKPEEIYHAIEHFALVRECLGIARDKVTMVCQCCCCCWVRSWPCVMHRSPGDT